MKFYGTRANIWPAFFRFLQQSMLPDSSFTAYRLQPLQMEVWDAKRTVVSFCDFPGEVWNWWKMLMSHLYSFVFICIHLYSFVFICIHLYSFVLFGMNK